MVLRTFGGGHDWYPQYSIGSMPVGWETSYRYGSTGLFITIECKRYSCGTGVKSYIVTNTEGTGKCQMHPFQAVGFTTEGNWATSTEPYGVVARATYSRITGEALHDGTCTTSSNVGAVYILNANSSSGIVDGSDRDEINLLAQRPGTQPTAAGATVGFVHTLGCANHRR